MRVPAGLYKRGNLLVDALHNAQREQLKKIGVMTDDAPLKVNFKAPFATRMGMRVVLGDDVLNWNSVRIWRVYSVSMLA